MIICDIITLSVTLRNTYLLTRIATGSSQVRSSFASLLAKSGALYFGALLILNCIHIALWITDKFPYFADFSLPLTSIIISRFILHLRAVYISTSRLYHPSTRSQPSFLSTQVHFPTIEPTGPRTDSTIFGHEEMELHGEHYGRSITA
ncbi:hypothetical protein OBBRIDRAFT_603445 [Obba rivulosa]|uniref:Uncharacterized protein n=1 Tax=Obba rivulosa TaxID=1052685 RepID=A0A8E2AY60_9APHY|nr:hypothetical protein OBBRIDRAFT_603445 [Obba rivulosa]